jgi:hypothetical protein
MERKAIRANMERLAIKKWEKYIFPNGAYTSPPKRDAVTCIAGVDAENCDVDDNNRILILFLC